MNTCAATLSIGQRACHISLCASASARCRRLPCTPTRSLTHVNVARSAHVAAVRSLVDEAAALGAMTLNAQKCDQDLRCKMAMRVHLALWRNEEREAKLEEKRREAMLKAAKDGEALQLVGAPRWATAVLRSSTAAVCNRWFGVGVLPGQLRLFCWDSWWFGWRRLPRGFFVVPQVSHSPQPQFPSRTWLSAEMQPQCIYV